MARRNGRWLFRLCAAGLGLFGALPLAVVLWAWVLPVPGTLLMVQRTVEGEGWRHEWISIDEVPFTLFAAIVAGEDNNYCFHQGVDWTALAKAVKEVERGKRDQARGASTLSMQVAKNLLLWPGRDLIRKGLELTYVNWIEALWSKRRILEVYVNIVEWGPGIYGVEAASRSLFGVPAAKMTERQAALLAAVLPNPREWNAGNPGPYVKQRASELQQRARDLVAAGYLDCMKPGK